MRFFCGIWPRNRKYFFTWRRVKSLTQSLFVLYCCWRPYMLNAQRPDSVDVRRDFMNPKLLPLSGKTLYALGCSTLINTSVSFSRIVSQLTLFLFLSARRSFSSSSSAVRRGPLIGSSLYNSQSKVRFQPGLRWPDSLQQVILSLCICSVQYVKYMRLRAQTFTYLWAIGRTH